MLHRFFRFLNYHRENSFPLVALALAWLGIHYAESLTGRAVIDDPGQLVAMLYNFTGASLVIVLTGWTVPHFVGDAKDTDPAWKHWLELCAVCFFASLFSFLIFR